jgi:ABC-type polysaccharide/polyol phosphate transport system ATPase subunit
MATPHRLLGLTAMSLVVAEGVTVDFPVYGARTRSLKNAVVHAATGGRVAADVGRRVTVRALDGVSFTLERGDRIALVGHNGSGKSTLLRVLAGTYHPTGGRLVRRGRVAALLSLSLGMDPEATGWENLRVQGLVAGLDAREIEATIDEIAAFTGLGDYLDMPLRTYSSGMLMRIGFAVATAREADVLLADEWLGAADAAFIEAAERRLARAIERTGVLVLASHSRPLLEKFCTRAMILEQGRLVDVVPLPEALRRL